MRKVILIFSLVISSVQTAFSEDKLYDWQEIGRIECKRCNYISFSNDNRLLVKSGLFSLLHIDIQSYEKMKYTIVSKGPYKLYGYLGLLFVPSQSSDISPNDLYYAEIDLEKGRVYGNSIIIYKKVLTKDLINKRLENFEYWKKIENNCIMATCVLGTLSLAYWCLKNS